MGKAIEGREGKGRGREEGLRDGWWGMDPLLRRLATRPVPGRAYINGPGRKISAGGDV